MSATYPNESVKVAIVGMTGSGKTVLISTLASRMTQMAEEGVFMAPFGDNRLQTLQKTQSNWTTLNKGNWPPSTPAEELLKQQWELSVKNCQAQVQFLNCSGQDLRAFFQTDNFNPGSLSEERKNVYEAIRSANILIFLVNMKDLLANPDWLETLSNPDQIINTLNKRCSAPRKMAIAFSQYDRYKSEVDQKFKSDFLEYLQHYIPLLHGQYIQKRNFEIIPVSAVYNPKSVTENDEVKLYPVPGFSSYNLKKLIYWIANGVVKLAPEIQKSAQQSGARPVVNSGQIKTVPAEPAVSNIPHAPSRPVLQTSTTPSRSVQPVHETPKPSVWQDASVSASSKVGGVPKLFSHLMPRYTLGKFTFPWAIVFITLILSALYAFLDYYTQRVLTNISTESYDSYARIFPAFFDSSVSYKLKCVLFYNVLQDIIPYASLIGIFFTTVLLYRCWNTIQDGHAWIYPSICVFLCGISFIPEFVITYASYYSKYDRFNVLGPVQYLEGSVFHIVFCVIYLSCLLILLCGLSRCLNNYIFRYSLVIKTSSTFLTFVTCLCLSWALFVSQYWTVLSAYNLPTFGMDYSQLWAILSVTRYILFIFALNSVMRTARDIQRMKMQHVLNKRALFAMNR